MAENRLTLQNGYIYSYNGTDGRYSLVFGGINEAIVDDLIISGSSYLGDSSADRVEVTGSLKARNITGSIHTVDGNSPFLVAGSNVTTNFNAGTGQWTVSSTGGSSTPGGSANQVQLANGSGASFSGSDGLWFNSTGSILYLSGNLVTAGNINANANTPRSIFTDVVDITVGGASSVVNIAGDLKVTGNEIKSSANQVALTLSNTDVSVGGNLTVSGNVIKSSTNTAMTLNGPSVTVGGDIQVSGNQIKSNTGAIALQLTGSSVTVGANLIVSGNTSLGNASNDSTTVVGQFTSRHITGSIYRVDGNNLFLNAGSNVTTTFDNATGQWTIAATGGGGSGDVVGPASATDNAIARFDLATGKLIQNSALTISDLSSNTVNFDGPLTMNLFNGSTSINLGNNAEAQTITIGGISTKGSTYNFGTGNGANGVTKRINIGTNGVSGSPTRINLGSTAGGGIITVSGSLAYKGSLYASDILTTTTNLDVVPDNVRYIRGVPTGASPTSITISIPPLSELVHGRVLTISNMTATAGNITKISPSVGDKLVILGTADLAEVSLTTQRQWVELVAQWVSGDNNNGWYVVCGGLVPTLD